eukprot:symbB.v1.2.041044.t1/scaffold7774.1/size9349/2
MGVRIIGVMKQLSKGGVVSCFPHGHGELPTAGPTMPPSGAIVEHDKGLLALQQLPVAGPEARVNAIRDSWGNSSFSLDFKGGYKESKDNFYGNKPAL